MIKGYKGFNKDMKCRGYQFQPGEEYEEKTASCCESGFHFCENPMHVFGYYPPSDSRYCEIEGDGIVDKADDDSKVAVSKIRIGVEIGLSGIINAGVKFILDRVDFRNAKESNTGYRSAATNTGYQSAATNTGYQSAATNAGVRSAATNTGDQSAATNTGYQSAATNTGAQSAATNTGYQSAATNTGVQSAATNTGDHSAATNTGDQSAATNTGDRSAATVSGKDSIAHADGYMCKASGALGCGITVAERGGWNGETYPLINIKAAIVDGETIKPDTYYMLVDGKFVETE